MCSARHREKRQCGTLLAGSPPILLAQLLTREFISAVCSHVTVDCSRVCVCVTRRHYYLPFPLSLRRTQRDAASAHWLMNGTTDASETPANLRVSKPGNFQLAFV